MFSEWIRRTAFDAFDALKGSPVMSHYNDIKQRLDSAAPPDEERINAILDYAVRHTDYYRELAGQPLESFPIVTKAIIKSNENAFKSKEYIDKKVIPMRTSGSSGTPFTVFQDVGKRNRCLAEMMYFWGLAGYRTGMKYIFFRSWNGNRKSKITAAARNLVMYDGALTQEQTLEEVRQLLKKGTIHFILGYASSLEDLAAYLHRNNDTPDMFSINGIVAISEALSQTAAKRLGEVFGCPVVSHYSNSENGVLAQQCLCCDRFVVNTASFKIELLSSDSDSPVAAGEAGRVVVTDLYNHAMPIIRYDTGDTAIAGESGTHAQTLLSIEGRLLDYIYDAGGRRISPHELSVAFWKFPQLDRYQFVQYAPARYTVRLRGATTETGELVSRELFTVLGDNADISVEYVDEIPPLASGKRKYIVNDMENRK